MEKFLAKSRRRVILPIFACLILPLFAACSSAGTVSEPAKTTAAAPEASAAPVEASAAPVEAQVEKLKVAFVYYAMIDPAEGWNEAHHRVQVELEETMADKLDMTVIENIPEGPGSLKTFEDLGRQKYDIVFGTTFGFMDQMEEAAKSHPETLYVNAAGYKQGDNFTNYFGKQEQARFLSGMIAGGMTKTGKIGYVGAFPIPIVIRGINAFTLGAQKVNPDATVTVVWTNSWFDPTADKQAGTSLVQQGHDVLSNETDSPGTGQAAEEGGAYWLSSYSDQSSFAPNAWLGGQCWDFAPFIKDEINKAIAGTWVSQSYMGDLANGMVALCGPSDLVPAELAAQVEEAKASIIDGTLDIWAGPIFDQQGKEKVPAGGTVSEEDQATMDWFAKGVIGNAAG